MISAMSSTKHKPILGNRPNREVAPEFPLPTGTSFAATKEFAEKTQEALLSVQQDLLLAGVAFPGNTFLFLPLITPNSIQQRFQVGEDHSVYVIITKSYPLLKTEVESLNFYDYRGICVRGPIGAGKSYLLYLLACDYRLNRQKNRVTYIHDCTAWKRLSYHYLLEALAATFYDDIIDGMTIVKWCQAVKESKMEEDMMRTMINALINYIKQNDLLWLVICDQHNALYSSSAVHQIFPFNLIHFLAGECRFNIKVVVSASANNEDYPIKMKGWLPHDVYSHRFDDDEFKMWCDHYQLEHIGKVNHESEEAVDALFWTGGNPYELDLLWKQPAVTLMEKTMLYRKNRVREMAQSHALFCEKMSIQRERNLEECVSRMALGLSPPNSRVGMDQQLFDLIPDNTCKGNFLLTALTLVARQALIAYHGEELLTVLGMVAGSVFKGL